MDFAFAWELSWMGVVRCEYIISRRRMDKLLDLLTEENPGLYSGVSQSRPPARPRRCWTGRLQSGGEWQPRGGQPGSWRGWSSPGTCRGLGLRSEHSSGSASRCPDSDSMTLWQQAWQMTLWQRGLTLSLWVMASLSLLVITWSWMARMAFVSDFIQATYNKIS